MKTFSTLMMTMTTLLPISLALGACLDDGSAADDGTAVTTELAWPNPIYYQCAPGLGPTCRKLLGSGSTQTCFLAGIKGEMSGLFGGTGVEVDIRADGNYYIDITGATTDLVTVTAVCTTDTANRLVGSYTAGSGFFPLIAPVTAKRQCFLSKLNVSPGLGFTQYTDSVFVSPTGVNNEWIVGGQGDGNWSAEAVCFDVASNIGTASEANPSSSGNRDGHLGGTNAAGVQCGLRALGGDLVTTASGGELGSPGENDDWTDSVGPLSQITMDCFNQ